MRAGVVDGRLEAIAGPVAEQVTSSGLISGRTVIFVGTTLTVPTGNRVLLRSVQSTSRFDRYITTGGQIQRPESELPGLYGALAPNMHWCAVTGADPGEQFWAGRSNTGTAYWGDPFIAVSYNRHLHDSEIQAVVHTLATTLIA